MTEIAKKAGVSQPLVSSVLNGRKSTIKVSDIIRDKILAIAEQEGYVHNRLLTSILKGRTGMLAFITRETVSNYAAEVLSGALKEAENRSFILKVMTIERPEDSLGIIRKCIEYRTEGILCYSPYSEFVQALNRNEKICRVPVVMIDNCPIGWKGDRIFSDDADGARKAVSRLISLGHRRIAFISNIRDYRFTTERLRGYREAICEAGIGFRSDLTAFCPHSFQEYDRAASEFLKRRPAPTAFFCATDFIAAGVVRAANKLNLKIPGDISVIGFGDQEAGRYIYPLMTTVSQPFEKMGAEAVKRISERLKNKKSGGCKPKELILPTKLIMRESIAAMKSETASASRVRTE